MPVVGLCSFKGGVGKTTVCFNLAERAVAYGWKVVVVDYDPQEGSVGLMDLRDRLGWEVWRGRLSAGGGEGGVRVAGVDALEALRSGGEYDFVFCDLPGTDSMAMGRILLEMDLVLSPVGVGAADLMAAINFFGLVRRSGFPVVFLPNNLPFGRRRLEGMLEELAEREMELCPAVLHRRVSHLDALRAGLGVCEAFPNTNAALEVDALWQWLCGRLGV